MLSHSKIKHPLALFSGRFVVVLDLRQQAFVLRLASEKNCCASYFIFEWNSTLADNGKGVWNIDLANDLKGCSVVERGKGLMKEHFFMVELKAPFSFSNSGEIITLESYEFCFKKKDEQRFPEIMNKVFA